jgi:hypothetical protein
VRQASYDALLERSGTTDARASEPYEGGGAAGGDDGAGEHGADHDGKGDPALAGLLPWRLDLALGQFLLHGLADGEGAVPVGDAPAISDLDPGPVVARLRRCRPT